MVEPVVAELVVAELVVAELVEASKHRNHRKKRLTKLVVSTGSTTEDVNIGKLISAFYPTGLLGG